MFRRVTLGTLPFLSVYSSSSIAHGYDVPHFHQGELLFAGAIAVVAVCVVLAALRVRSADSQ